MQKQEMTKFCSFILKGLRLQPKQLDIKQLHLPQAVAPRGSLFSGNVYFFNLTIKERYIHPIMVIWSKTMCHFMLKDEDVFSCK